MYSTGLQRCERISQLLHKRLRAIRAYEARSDALEKARRQGAAVTVASPITLDNATAREFSEIIDPRQIETSLYPA